MITTRPAETLQELEAAENIQLTVFNVEQGIPEETCREGNQRATHVLAYDGEQPIATGRLVVEAGSCAELARIAVLKSHRGRGVGGKVVIALEEIAANVGATRLSLNPHQYLEPFYQRLGYVADAGDAEDVAGHSLITMRKVVSP
jgi:predicted GNAT family N-acyltransferase